MYPNCISTSVIKKFCVFIGDSGSGKRSLVRHMLFKLEKDGYEICPVNSLKDFCITVDTLEKRVFVLEHVFGVLVLDLTKVSVCIDHELEILRKLKNAKLLMTCSTSIYLEGAAFKPFIFNNGNVVNLRNGEYALTENDKSNVLKKYHYESSEFQEVVRMISKSTLMFLLICKSVPMDMVRAALRIQSFETFPDLLNTLLDILSDNQPNVYNELVSQALEIRTSHMRSNKKLKQIFELTDDSSNPQNISDISDTRVVPQTSHQHNIFQILLSHEETLNTVIVHYGKNHPEHLIGEISCGFLAKYVCVDKNESHLTIAARRQLFPVLAERFFNDCRASDIHVVLNHKIWFNNEFVAEFEDLLRSKTNKEIDLFFTTESLHKSVNTSDVSSKFSQDENNTLHLLLDKEYHRLEVLTRMKVISFLVYYGIGPLVNFFYLNVKSSKHMSLHEQARLLLLCAGSPCTSDTIVKVLLENMDPRSINSTCLRKTSISELNNHRRRTPFTSACYSGNAYMVSHFIDLNVDLNRRDDFKETPLIAASTSGHMTIVEQLIKNGADINLCAENGVSPLSVALAHGHLEIVDFLLTKGADAKSNVILGKVI